MKFFVISSGRDGPLRGGRAALNALPEKTPLHWKEIGNVIHFAKGHAPIHKYLGAFYEFFPDGIVIVDIVILDINCMREFALITCVEKNIKY